jgi:hypothetical protein
MPGKTIDAEMQQKVSELVRQMSHVVPLSVKLSTFYDKYPALYPKEAWEYHELWGHHVLLNRALIKARGAEFIKMLPLDMYMFDKTADTIMHLFKLEMTDAIGFIVVGATLGAWNLQNEHSKKLGVVYMSTVSKFDRHERPHAYTLYTRGDVEAFLKFLLRGRDEAER